MPFFQDAHDELRPLNTYEKQIIALTVCGAFFSCFDFTIYFFFDEAISQAFLPNVKSNWLESSAFLVLIVIGYISRPLGSVVLSHFGDKSGRKRVMLLSLYVVSVATLLICILPTYHQIGLTALVLLLVLRFCQGFGFGAEAPASWVTLAEHMPRRHIGSVCGMLIASFVFAVLVSNLLSSLISSMLTPAQMNLYGWRIPFLLGSLGTFVAILLRQRIAETPIWLNAKKQGNLLAVTPLKQVLTKHQFATLMTFGLSWFTSSVFVISFLIIPTLGIEYFDISDSLMSVAVGIGSLFAVMGTLLYGFCADRFNSARVFAVGCILLAVSCGLFFVTLRMGSELIMLSYAIFGFCAGIIGIVPSICVRLFPVEVRMSGVGFSYNIAYAITGAVTPYLLIKFSEQLSITSMLYVAFLCLMGVIMSLFLTDLHGLYRMEVVESKAKTSADTYE